MVDKKRKLTSGGLLTIGIISIGAGLWIGIDFLITAESAGLFDKQTETAELLSKATVLSSLVFPAILLLIGIVCSIASTAIDVWNGRFHPDARSWTQRWEDWLTGKRRGQ